VVFEMKLGRFEPECVFVWGAGKSFRVEQEIRMTNHARAIAG
jgi:hypothetical protein